jgi:hypothetical protein
MSVPVFRELLGGVWKTVIASEAKQSIASPKMTMDLLRRGACHRARIRATRWFLAMTPRCESTISPRGTREFCREAPALSNQRAQGMPGARCTHSLVCEIKKHTSIVTTVTPETPGTPRAMVLTVSFALSSVTGLSCHRRLRNRFRKLDASVGASGPHDFAPIERAAVPGLARSRKVRNRSTSASASGVARGLPEE